MSLVHHLLSALVQVLSPGLLAVILFGVLFGFIFGAIPGLGPVIAMVLLFPVTLAMDPLPAVVLLAAVYPAGVYGGSVTAVLVNTPGDPSSTVTTFDGYPMTKRGEGTIALGVILAASVIGGLLSALALLLIAPPFARIALQIGPEVVFAIGLFGVVILVVVSRGSMLKGLIASVFGFLLAMVGFSPFRGVERFTFGVDYLQGGIPIVPLIIGLFAISEALMLIYQGGSIEQESKNSVSLSLRARFGELNSGLMATVRRPVSVLRSSAIGIGIGIVPGAGSIISNFVSYYVGQTFTKKGKEFGTGVVEGLIAAESSNNAATAATLIPTLVLAIPGGVAAAILLGAMRLQNIRVGPLLFAETPVLAYAIILSLFVANICMLLVGYSLSSLLQKVVKLPVEIVAPMVLVLGILGGFAYNFSTMDAVAVMVFGVLGFVIRKLGYSPVAIVFAFILGPILEENYLRAVQVAGGDPFVIVTSPASAVIIGLAVVVLVYQLVGELNDVRTRLNIREPPG